MARVIISAGHSPTDKGAVVGDLVEYDLTRRIVDELEPMLAKYPKLELKRIPEGLSLPQKILWINQSGYTGENNDIAVEVHINDSDGTEEGVECWQAERGDNASKDLCTKILDAVCKESGLKKRSVKSEYDHQFRRLGYVHNTQTISGLFEIGYMDHPKDKEILTSDAGIKKLATGILKGILAYFGLKEGEVNKDPIAKPAFPVHTQPDQYSVPFGITPPADSAPSTMPSTMPKGVASPYSSTTPSSYPMRPRVQGAVPSQPIMPTMPMSSAPTMSVATPQEKQEEITRLYQKVLGRNPDAAGLGYYANSQMSEAALMKMMVESQEHQNLIKAAKDYVTVKGQLERLEREITSLRSRMADKDSEIQSLSAYLQEKSRELSQMTEERKASTSEDNVEKASRENGRMKRNDNSHGNGTPNHKPKSFGVFEMVKKLKK